MLWMAGLVACELVQLVSDEPSTLVRDVRTVAMVMEPPEVAPNGFFEIAPYVFNPQGFGLEVMAWTCVPNGDRCLELAWGIEPVTVSGWRHGQVLQLQVPPLDATLLLVSDGVPVPVYLLACETGLCPIIEEVALHGRSAASDGLVDPGALLAELPEAGVFLSAHSVRVSSQALKRDQNPSIEVEEADAGGCDLPLEIAPDQRVPICLLTSDDDGGPMVAYSYTTAGRLDSPRERVRSRRVRFEYIAPTAAQVGGLGGRVDVVVVAEEEDGSGSAVFAHSFLVLLEE